ncbi:MAG: CoA pyrophosphatase [Rubrivivax sp.]|jgi:8-oxo-dGTP pyrophosphatase MutT (NUDIX family)|nr:CoA pyrophosphatase [Rubrivivax sp.]
MNRPRIVDPHAVPVAGTDAHLPPVDPARLTAPALRQRFATGGDWRAVIGGDGRIGPDRPMSAAAVLVALVERDGGLGVLLTRRTEHLRDHAGQISFPGGRAEAGDADAAATALREAEEEIGLSPACVEVIGRLPDYTTVTRFVVAPVVGLVRPPFALRPDPSEVAEAFEVPLAFLMNPAHHRRHQFVFEGGQRQFLSMPWQGAPPGEATREYFIWGATAAMLRNLYHFLAD